MGHGVGGYHELKMLYLVICSEKVKTFIKNSSIRVRYVNDGASTRQDH